MTDYTFKQANMLDISKLVYDLRKVEKDEIIASAGMSPIGALTRDLELSQQCISAYADDKILAIFGVIPVSLMSDKAVPWMLTTNELPNHKRFLLKGSRNVIKHWNNIYPLLFNYVDARHTQSLNWARHVGFTVYDPEPFGVYDMPFHRIESRRE